MRQRFNLSEWALEHQTLVLFFMIVLAAIGIGSYLRLGQAEDPDFTFKLMVVRTMWPGASAEEVERQLTDKIERKLQETPRLDFLRSYSKPGESVVFVFVKDNSRPEEIKDTWYQVRKKVGDIRLTLPQGVIGPFFNDEFGDTFGNIYALTGDGFTYAQLKETADRIRNQLLRVKDVAKVDLIGEQDEKIYVELANAKLATFGIEPALVFAALQQQNAVSATGSFETPTDRIYIRATGALDSVESVKQIAIRANGRLFRLGDIANVTRGFADPAQPRMRYMGRDALGIAVSMVPRGDIIALGKALDAETERIEGQLPVGLELDRVNDQPATVKRSVGEFTRALAEAVTIVLIVSFVSLGLRTGLIVALSIPLTLFVTFAFMYQAGVDLHKISLGALIISLGLLVDDAIISVEMMVVKMEQGWERAKAASFAYTSTAMPMLTGTIVTAAGFLPIGLARSSTGEYTFSIFAVTTTALLVSWVVSVLFVPYLGYKLLPDFRKAGVHLDEGAVYRKPFYQRFRRVVEWSVDHRRVVIAATAGVFLLSIFGFKFVQQQFFPAASRPELIVDLRLQEGASIDATQAQVKKMEALLMGEPLLRDNIENFVSYVGSGSPRFYLPFDQQLVNANFGQFIVNTKNNESREWVRARLLKAFDEDFPEVRGRVNRLENGPPVGFPVQFRVIGEDKEVIRGIANQVSQVMRDNAWTRDVNFDWDEPSKVIRLTIDQNRARVLGISTQELSAFLSTVLSGSAITTYREADKQVDVVVRGAREERVYMSLLKDLAVPIGRGRTVPLAQIANLTYGFEQGIYWRRDRLPVITVRSDLKDGIQAPVVSAQVNEKLEAIRSKLPFGYRIDTGGAVEDAGKGQKSIAIVAPVMILVMITALMLQLQSFSRLTMVLLTAPLGLIGVVAALLVFNVPFGFVAMLGTIALAGMIMRNSVILVDQIEQDIRNGSDPYEAITDATVRRLRPIVLTAAAAVLAMIPLTRSAFYGPMAVAIMGGLVVATVITLVFLPALYAAWYRVRRPTLQEAA
ncbi:Cobalt-zinc-cadmium resistance protein CzcA [Usitatibacter rugosus]|uniref:Cobalt-zinc-cadmium resistance protein CzcA n=1 Tax=Usitatibacter rugosus TaxID=2732067 RepID=A0A6M4GWE4_9PROT|nr:efflux RND transporter permease subunit [Usitatibacter rugosus]QJR11610.1 Cobalt-zinc-cadmium resistance protein CzcA [Usitatibacter rugosus]